MSRAIVPGVRCMEPGRPLLYQTIQGRMVMTSSTRRRSIAVGMASTIASCVPLLAAPTEQDFWRAHRAVFDRSRIQSLTLRLLTVNIDFSEKGANHPRVSAMETEVAQDGERLLFTRLFDNGARTVVWRDAESVYEGRTGPTFVEDTKVAWTIRPLADPRAGINPAETWLRDCTYKAADRQLAPASHIEGSWDPANRTMVGRDTRYGVTTKSSYVEREGAALFVREEIRTADGCLMQETEREDWVQVSDLWFPRRLVVRNYMLEMRIDRPAVSANVQSICQKTMLRISVNSAVPPESLTRSIPEGAKVSDLRVDPPVSYKYKKELTLGQIAEMARQRALEKEIQGKR